MAIKYYYRLAFKIIAITAAVLAVVSGIFAYKFRTLQSRAEFLKANPSVTKFLPVYWQIRKLSDITYLSYLFKQDEMPAYELEISTDNLNKLNASLPNAFMGVNLVLHEFVPAIFRAEGKAYDVSVRYRGERAKHWNAPKKSYLIKFKKNDLFHDQSELSFIIPDDRLFAVEQFNNYRANKLGLNTPASGFANLEVNGQGPALYFVIESWSREMLEKWSVSKESILYSNTSGGEGLWQDLANWQVSVRASSGDKDDFSKLEELITLLNTAPDSEFNAKIFEMIDKNNFYAWQIHQELVNSGHQFDDNVRMYYNPVAGKFFFIPWDVEIEPVSHNRFGQYGQLAGRIFANPVFLQEKNALLDQYVSDDSNLAADLKYYDDIYESFRVSLYHDRLKIYTNRFADREYALHRQEIMGIFHALRTRLETQNPGDFGAVRIEDDFSLAYPLGKTEEIVAYLKNKYIADSSFVISLGPEFSATFGDEDFTDTYFDTPKLDLYQRKAGLRYRFRVNRLDGEASKSGRELIQLKLSGTDKFADLGNTGSRNEIKYDVEYPRVISSADDRHAVLGLIPPQNRQEFKDKIRELGLDPMDLRPILTINQRRQRVYVNRSGETFISFSMDDAHSSLWWAKSEFSQMEVELNELAYTGADPELQKQMQAIRQDMIADLRAHFSDLQDDKSIKYTKMFDLLEKRLLFARFFIRAGIMRGAVPQKSN